MKHLKTKYVKVRVTAEEAALIKEKSAGYTSVTHFVRSALEEYSHVNARQRLELVNELGQFYRKWQNELSWAGGNLNQTVKRANELAIAGLLAPSYIQEVLMPAIRETQETISEIKRELYNVTKKGTKLRATANLSNHNQR